MVESQYEEYSLVVGDERDWNNPAKRCKIINQYQAITYYFLNIKSCVLAAITPIMIIYVYIETSMNKHSLSSVALIRLYINELLHILE